MSTQALSADLDAHSAVDVPKPIYVRVRADVFMEMIELIAEAAKKGDPDAVRIYGKVYS